MILNGFADYLSKTREFLKLTASLPNVQSFEFLVRMLNFEVSPNLFKAAD